jgi:hypothetical protein
VSLHLCDGCGKLSRDVRSVGRDSNGDPDAPDLCFFCRQRIARGQFLFTDPEERAARVYHHPTTEQKP